MVSPMTVDAEIDHHWRHAPAVYMMPVARVTTSTLLASPGRAPRFTGKTIGALEHDRNGWFLADKRGRTHLAT
jgi:hypothetical protein